MISAKNQASQRPYAMGTMLQASTYGHTIPVIIGRTQSPALAIWAANLRQGGSGKKFKSSKKGITTYCENIDFLLGHNPARGVLQAWANGGKYPLTFTSQTFTSSGGRQTFTISDPHFHQVVGVTLTMAYSAVFNDYGSQELQSASGEAQTIPSSGPYTVTVTNASAYLSDQGVKYATGGASLTKITSGTPAAGQYLVNTTTGVYTFAAADAGKGVLISYTYGSLVSGSYEVPLWNELETGPDPTDPMSYRHWPFSYRWQDAFGTSVNVDAQAFPTGTLKIYYSQLMSATSYLTPLQKLRLSFEKVLGSGSEYAGFSSQQIKYHHFFGVGSPNIDLGSAGTLPQLELEVAGKWGLYSTGDADFVDMIEDTVKSGLAQAAIGQNGTFPPVSQLERGCSGYSYPGTIQKKVDQSTTVAISSMLYDMPNVPGNILVVQVASAGSALGISSSNGETWSKVLGDGLGYQVWYATAVGGSPNTVTISGSSGTSWSMNIMEVGGIGAVDDTRIYFGSGGPATVGGTKTGVYSFATNAIDMSLTNFQLTGTMPGDALIQGTYAVANATAVYGGGTMTLRNGKGSGLVPFSGFSASSGYYYNFSSYGTSLQGIQNVIIRGDIAQSNFSLPGPCGWVFGNFIPTDSLSLSGAIAIYYTSATPHIDPYLPPPFPVPAGQGLAWALPYQAGGDFPPCMVFNCGTWVNTQSGNAIVPLYRGGFMGSSSPAGGGSFVLDGSGNAFVNSTVTAGFPGYLLSLPYYSGGAPALSEDIQQWKYITPTNVFGKIPSTIQAHDRTISNPGTYSINVPGLPDQHVILSFKSTQPATYPKPVGSFLDRKSLQLTRQQCRAYGLWGSVSMNAQQPAREWLNTFYTAANAAPAFWGHKLYSIPYAEASAAGNGAVYISPTASGPVADLSTLTGSILGGVEVVTASRNDLPNFLRMQCIGRTSDYNQITVSQPGAASIAFYGKRKDDPVVNNAVQDASVARSLLGVTARRNQYGGDSYKFSISAKYGLLLSPMDLVTITDPLVNVTKRPVRLTSIVEQDGSFDCEARPFVYGMESPGALSLSAPSPYVPSTNSSAANVNAPVIFEPVPRLYGNQNQAQLWLVVSCSDPNYGGCQVYISTDGGSSYNPAGNPLLGSATTGVTTASWPSAADPDTTNDLPVDLTESNGTLQTYLVSDEDNFVYPCYVAGGSGSIPYELMTYATATLTSANHYTLKATGGGNKLRRAVFNAPTAGTGASHSSGARFALLPPAGTGILKLTMDPNWIGKTLWFKFPSFNTFGSAQQSLSGLTAYSYMPTGGSGSVNPNGAPPQQFQVNGA